MPNTAGQSNQILPAAPIAALTNVRDRSTGYGDKFTAPALTAPQTQALEGSRYVALPTPAAGGTGTAQGIQVAFSDTANATIAILNTTAGQTKNIVVDYIRGRCTAAGSTTTSSEVSIEVDPLATRYTSGGTALTAYQCNTAGVASKATVYQGAITCAAAGTGRQFIGQQLIRVAAAPCWIVNDVVLFTFGGVDVTQLGNIAGPLATSQIQASFGFSPFVIPPGSTGLVHVVNVANATTAPSWCWEIGWVEK